MAIYSSLVCACAWWACRRSLSAENSLQNTATLTRPYFVAKTMTFGYALAGKSHFCLFRIHLPGKKEVGMTSSPAYTAKAWIFIASAHSRPCLLPKRFLSHKNGQLSMNSSTNAAFTPKDVLNTAARTKGLNIFNLPAVI